MAITENKWCLKNCLYQKVHNACEDKNREQFVVFWFSSLPICAQRYPIKTKNNASGKSKIKLNFELGFDYLERNYAREEMW